MLTCTRKKKNAYRIFTGKREGKRSLETNRCRWEDIKMDLKKI
jgi:hypothetical protein